MTDTSANDSDTSICCRFAVVCEGKRPPEDKLAALAGAIVDIEECLDLDGVASRLRQRLPQRGWFVRRGGWHVALH